MREISYRGTATVTLEDISFILTERTSDVLFGMSALIVAIVAFLILKRVFLGQSLPLRRMTLPSFFCVIYIFFMSFPAIIWFSISSHPIRYTYLLAVQGVPVLFLMGVWMASLPVRRPSSIIAGFLSSSLEKTWYDARIAGFGVLILLCSILIVGLFMITSDWTPLLVSLTRYGEIEGELVRHSVYALPQSIQYAHALAVRFFLPFCALYALLMAHIYRGKWKIIFWITFCFALFASLLTLERSHTLGLFLELALASYFARNMRISAKHIVVLGVALFVGGIVHQAQYQLDISLMGSLDYMTSFFLNRIFMDPSYMTLAAFQEYNDTTGFLHGKSIRLLSLFGVEYESFSSVGFVGDLWANFGWSGVLMGPIVIGFVLEFIQLKFFRKKNIATVTVYVMLLLNAVWILYGSVLSTMVVSVYSLGVLFLVCLNGQRHVLTWGSQCRVGRSRFVACGGTGDRRRIGSGNILRRITKHSES